MDTTIPVKSKPARRSARVDPAPQPAVAMTAAAATPEASAAAIEAALAPPQQEARMKKPKLVRDRYTMPKEEYLALAELKQSCDAAGVKVKRSDLLRAGLALLRKLQPAQLQQALSELPQRRSARNGGAKQS